MLQIQRQVRAALFLCHCNLAQRNSAVREIPVPGATQCTPVALAALGVSQPIQIGSDQEEVSSDRSSVVDV